MPRGAANWQPAAQLLASGTLECQADAWPDIMRQKPV
jgi:hypothetical protein